MAICHGDEPLHLVTRSGKLQRGDYTESFLNVKNNMKNISTLYKY